MPTPEALVAGAELDAVPAFPLPGSYSSRGSDCPCTSSSRGTGRWCATWSGRPRRTWPWRVFSDATEPVPPFCAVAGLWALVSHQRLADGRFNILLEGVGRVRLEERPFVPPYRRARATVLAEPDPAEVDGLAQASLLAVAAGYLAEGRGGALGPSSVSALCLRLAERAVSDPAARQAILESATAAERVRRTTDALALERLAAQAWTASGEG